MVKRDDQNINQIMEWGEIDLNGLSSGPKNIDLGTGAEFIEYRNVFSKNNVLKKWFIDKSLNGIITMNQGLI